MATTPIVTEVTKEQLDALVVANGLNEGLQYKVTDKGWLLIAISNNILIPQNDILNLSFSDVFIPTYIKANRVYLDSGIIPCNGHEFGVDSPIDVSFDGNFGLQAVSIGLNGFSGEYSCDFHFVDEDSQSKKIASLGSGTKKRVIISEDVISAFNVNNTALYHLQFTTLPQNYSIRIVLELFYIPIEI